MTEPLVARLLPDVVACVETFEDRPESALFPEEAAVVAGAVPKRRREFATVRHCARAALARLGYPPVPVLPGERGAPRWPDGVVGSMTHCDGYRAAAVAPADRVASLGIDAEPHQPLPDGVLSMIALPAEVRMLRRLSAARPEVCGDRLLFCVKEAVYKTWFPLTRRWLDFAEASVELDPDGRFTVHLLVDVPPAVRHQVARLAGRWRATGGLVAAAIAVTVPAGDATG